MPAVPIIAAGAAVVGAGAAVVGTVKSIEAQKKAAKAQAEQAGYVRQMDNLKAARERIGAIRQARLSAGAASQISVNQGASDTSASLGGIGSIISQLDSNLSFLDRSNTLSDQAGVQAGIAAKYQTKAQTASAIAGLGATIFSAAQNFTGAPKK